MQYAVRIILLALLIAVGPSALGDGAAWAEHQGDGPPGARPFRPPPPPPAQFRPRRPEDDGQYFERRQRPGNQGRGRNPGSEQDRARDAVRGGQALPLAEIIGGLQDRCPGTFLEARLQRTKQGLAYLVRILRPSGQRVTMLVDAATGAVVRGRCR